jgi:carboxymethylenebutenolidase
MSDTGTRFPRRAFAMAATFALAIGASAAPAAVPVSEKDVTVKTPDGSADAVLFAPSRGKGPWPEVILWPDLAGLRPAYRDIGRKIAAEGFVVLVPNPFYRSAKADGAEINMADPEVRKKRTDYRTAATDDGIARDAVAYVAFLDAQKNAAKAKKAGTVGYDVGGSYALRAAAALPDRVAAVSILYGLGVATPRPNSPHLLIPKTKATYFVASSQDDDKREPEDKADITKMIKDANLDGAVEVYPANHGWAVPGTNYDAAAAQRALASTLALFKSKL